MTPDSILLLGIGNLLCADEGFGVRALQELHRRWRFPEHVTLLDGGTQGVKLLPHVQSARSMIVFDAMDCGLAPGTVRVLANEEVPRFLGANKLSLHQTGFQEVLAVAALTGNHPEELVLIGVQPADIRDYGGPLSAVVRARIPTALAIALSRLRRWGCVAEARGEEPAGAEAILPASLATDGFGAPACRPGAPPKAAC
jgi:hydrogenase maturation protease